MTSDVIETGSRGRHDTGMSTVVGGKRGRAMHRSTDHTTFLRYSLLLDGIASALCGVILLAVSGPIASVIGLAEPRIAVAVGGLLVVYATALLWNARRPAISRGEVVTAVVLNAAWVVGSLIVIVDGPLTLVGNLAVAVIAAAVLLFGVLETVGLRRLRAA